MFRNNFKMAKRITFAASTGKIYAAYLSRVLSERDDSKFLDRRLPTHCVNDCPDVNRAVRSLGLKTDF